MTNGELLRKLDAAAYSHPDIMPPEIMRNDKAYYRIYFRYMAALYMLHEGGVLDIETLRNTKSAFMQDFHTFVLLFNAAAEGAHAFQKLNEAIIACNKNKDNCKCCEQIYKARLELSADEPDVKLKEGDNNGTD